MSARPPLLAAAAAGLDRRAPGVPVRAKDATVPFEWLEEDAAALAFIEELARVRRH